MTKNTPMQQQQQRIDTFSDNPGYNNNTLQQQEWITDSTRQNNTRYYEYHPVTNDGIGMHTKSEFYETPNIPFIDRQQNSSYVPSSEPQQFYPPQPHSHNHLPHSHQDSTKFPTSSSSSSSNPIYPPNRSIYYYQPNYTLPPPLPKSPSQQNED